MTESGPPFDRGLPSPLQALASLRAAGEESVVATGVMTERQRAMYVATAFDESLAARVRDDPRLRLVILTGSAGGGKSAAIRHLQEALPIGTFGQVVEDATHAESPSTAQTTRLAQVLSDLEHAATETRKVTLMAANTGLLVQLDADFRAVGRPGLADITAVALHALAVPGTRERPISHERRKALEKAVLVVDMDQRPTSGGDGRLLRRMLASFDPDKPTGVLGAAARCSTCRVGAWCAPRANTAMLAAPATAQVLDEAIEEVALRRGRDVPPRQLWDGISELAMGGLDHASDPCEAVAQLANRGDHRGVWLAMMPNGAFLKPQGELVREIADLDPSYRASEDVHRIFASTGIDPAADSQTLPALLEPLNAGPVARTAATGLRELLEAPETSADAARGLVRAHWFAGNLPLGQDVPPEFRKALDYLTSADGSAGGGRDGNKGDHDAYDAVLERIADGLVEAFGARLGPETYLPTENAAETRPAAVLAKVPLEELIDIALPLAHVRNPHGTRVVGARPLAARLRIRSESGHSNAPSLNLDLDLPLYRLLTEAAEGAVPSTADIERYHALRRAAERLGRTAAGGEATLLIKDFSGGTQFTVARRVRRNQSTLKIEKVV